MSGYLGNEVPLNAHHSLRLVSQRPKKAWQSKENSKLASKARVKNLILRAEIQDCLVDLNRNILSHLESLLKCIFSCLAFYREICCRQVCGQVESEPHFARVTQRQCVRWLQKSSNSRSWRCVMGQIRYGSRGHKGKEIWVSQTSGWELHGSHRRLCWL